MYGDAYYVSLSVSTDSDDLSLVFGNDVLVATGGRIGGDSYDMDTGFYADAGTISVQFGNDLLLGGDTLIGDGDYVRLAVYDYLDAMVEAAYTAGNDLMDGGEGDDVLYGDFIEFSTAEMDGSTITVNLGDDVIEGGAGDDVMVGDVGLVTSDIGITVNAGSDRFVFAGAFGDDRILDFQVGLDLLVVEGFGIGFNDLDIVENASSVDVSLTAYGGGTIHLEGLTTIAADSFLFV